MWIALMIVHGLVAFLLLAAVSYQAVRAVRPAAGTRGLPDSFFGMRSSAFTNAVVVLFVINFAIGAMLYANYSAAAKPEMILLKWLPTLGLFELKEHSGLVGLTLLPTYWLLWQRIPLSEKAAVRAWATVLLAGLVWWVFLVGYFVTNTRGIADEMVTRAL